MGGRKHIVTNFKAWDVVSVAAGNQTSAVSECEQCDKLVYQFTSTGTLAGTLECQFSTDGDNWRALDFGSPMLITTGGISHDMFINMVSWKWIRLYFTYTSGAGTIDARYSASTVGA